MQRNRVKDVRDELARLFLDRKFVSVNREVSMTSIVGSTTVEIMGASFVADEPEIFGELSHSYVEREEKWYMSQSRNVNDFPGGPPAIWKACAADDGTIVSNYGWAIFSEENGNQYAHAVAELKKNPESRRAEMIYTRPSMWKEYGWRGRNDFCCTDSSQYFVRDGQVHVCVRMRSNDALTGFKNDAAWQRRVLGMVANELDRPAGEVHWNVGSLHLYSSHFYFVDHYVKTGEITISKKMYRELYPTSEFVPNEARP